MPVPDYQTVMLPLLRFVGKAGTTTIRAATDAISDEFKLTPEERTMLLPSGNQEIIVNRVGWARTYMKKAGLLSSPQRGQVEITERGRQVLKENPAKINVEYLNRFPEFQAFRTTENDSSVSPVEPKAELASTETPEEQLEQSYQDLKSSLLFDVLDKVKTCSPQFFERLVVDTVVKMGYGGSRKVAGKAIGQSGDEKASTELSMRTALDLM